VDPECSAGTSVGHRSRRGLDEPAVAAEKRTTLTQATLLKSLLARRLLVAGIAGIALLLIASVAAAVIAGRLADRYYRLGQEIRLDPIGLQMHAALIEKAKAQPGRRRLVMFGDSRVAMWTPPAIEGYEIVNLGVGYQTTAQALLRFEREVPALRPQVVLIEIGVNDLRTIPLFPGQRDEIIRNCKENLRKLVLDSRALGATVVLTTIIPLGDISIWRRLYWAPEPVYWAIAEVNEFMRTLTTDRVVLFDANPILTTPTGVVKRPFQTDYLHESEAAYRALNEHLVPLVRRLPAIRAEP